MIAILLLFQVVCIVGPESLAQHIIISNIKEDHETKDTELYEIPWFPIDIPTHVRYFSMECSIQVRQDCGFVEGVFVPPGLFFTRKDFSRPVEELIEERIPKAGTGTSFPSFRRYFSLKETVSSRTNRLTSWTSCFRPSRPTQVVAYQVSVE